MTPRVSEKVVQEHIKQALRSVGAKVYPLGRPPRRDSAHKGTGIGIGLPDLLAHLPDATIPVKCGPRGELGLPCAHQLWIEVKAKGGKLREEQASFRDFCILAGIPHLVGGLDDVLAYLHQHGYIREYANYRKVGAA